MSNDHSSFSHPAKPSTYRCVTLLQSIGISESILDSLSVDFTRTTRDRDFHSWEDKDNLINYPKKENRSKDKDRQIRNVFIPSDPSSSIDGHDDCREDLRVRLTSRPSIEIEPSLALPTAENWASSQSQSTCLYITRLVAIGGLLSFTDGNFCSLKSLPRESSQHSRGTEPSMGEDKPATNPTIWSFCDNFVRGNIKVSLGKPPIFLSNPASPI